jgi:hypothetical protein
MRRVIVTLAATLTTCGALAATALAGPGAGGVAGPAFYVDGTLYRTVATPTTLPATAPDRSFDVIYEFFGLQTNVAEAAPGDRDYNGGRWMVHGLAFADYAGAVAAYDANGSGDFDSAEEVEAAIAGGAATDLGVVKRFVCPVIKFPGG